MAHTTPQVENGLLHLQEPAGQAAIPVGSREWRRWLEEDTVTTFHFKHPQGSFTARREYKSNGRYWYACRKLDAHSRTQALANAHKLNLLK